MLISAPPEKNAVYLGELSLLSDEGYEKSYILKILRKRASELGADVIWITRKKRVQSTWLINQQAGAHRSVKTKKIRTMAKMYRYHE